MKSNQVPIQLRVPTKTSKRRGRLRKLKMALGLTLLCNLGIAQTTCQPWSSSNGVWQGKGRIAISSDGNEHDKDDWAATPFSLALLAAKGLQNQLSLYTYSDHVWGSNHDHSNARQQMRTSALEGKEQFGFDNSKFMEAVADPTAAYNAMAAEINKSSSDNPLFIIAAGPMQVVGEGLKRANENKLQFVTVISHSKWNDRHSDNPSNWENHSGWTWDEMENTFKSKGVTFDHIVDQNGGSGYDGMRANTSKFNWLKTSSSRNDSHYKSSSWAWLYDRQVAAKKNTDFDPSDAGMIIYLLTGKEKTDPSDAKAIMENPVDACDGGTDGGGGTDDCNGYADDNGLIMMEAENTSSPLDLWIKKTDNGGYSGSGHLEFTGNGPNGGTAKSPLKYTFIVNKAGLYRLFIRARKRLDGQPNDKNNDGYVKMSGNFDQSPTASNQHNADATKALLTSNTKFFGGPANGWGFAMQLDAGGETNKRNAVYKFKAGETYTLTLSGRSVNWNVDRIVLRHESISNNAAFAVTEETKCSGTGGGGGNTDEITDINDLNASSPNCTSVKLAWSDVQGEDGYRIRRKVQGESTFTNLGDVAANVEQYTDNAVAENTTYIYQVRPLEGSQAVAESNNPVVTVEDCDVIPDITDINDLSATSPNCSSVNLVWSDIEGEDGYRVRRKEVGGSYVVLTDIDANEESFTDNSVAENTTYIYQVRPLEGTVAVATSNTPQISVDECIVEPDITDISDLAISVSTCSTVVITWSDINGEDGYRIRRKNQGESTFTNLGDVAANVEEYTDNTVAENATYIYQVRPLEGTKAVAISNNPQVTIDACVVEPDITDISDLAISASTCSTVVLSWSDMTGEDGYRVRRKKQGESTFTTLGDVPQNGTTYTDNNVVEGETYIYQVRPLEGSKAVAISNNPSVQIEVCVEEPTTEIGGNVHPNPFTNYVYITFNDQVSIQSVTLTNLNGGQSSTVNVQILGGNQIKVDMPSLEIGTYNLKVITDKGVFNKRIMKTN